MSPQATIYSRVLEKFNSKNLKFAFAYGSSVFKQDENAPNKSTIVDFVFVVDDSVSFHYENMQTNPTHYSFLRHLGPYYVSKIQDEFGAACYYNTLVKFDNDVLIKYGVMSTKYFLRDLYDWDYLYVSGRLHKPVHILKNDLQQTNALQTNLQNALHTSLLLLPERFTCHELFLKITSLSYNGDFRMFIGENKDKIRNIVEPNYEHFLELYKPIIHKENLFVHFNESTRCLSQDKSKNSIYHNLYFLPRNLMQSLITSSMNVRQYQDTEEILIKLANRYDIKFILDKALVDLVRHTSITQAAKGFFSAGVFKSIRYASRKLRKMIKF
jgi:translocator assembly and maintenance protein 41